MRPFLIVEQSLERASKTRDEERRVLVLGRDWFSEILGCWKKFSANSWEYAQRELDDWPKSCLLSGVEEFR